MKFSILLLGVLLTTIFLDYKISKIARVISFKETESHKEAITSFICLILASIFWAIYLSF